jgi:AraC-like DNA-binding protein
MPLGAPPQIAAAGDSVHGVHQLCERYAPLGVWCVHLYRYRARLSINGEWFEIQPGRATILPPDAVLEYRYEGPSVHAYCHFQLRSEGGAAVEQILMPAMLDLGPRFNVVNDQLEQVITGRAASPARATASLWDLLWTLSDASPGPATPTPASGATFPAPLRKVMQAIELRLAEPLYVEDLAREVDLSHNHLIRLFRTHVGQTPVAYLRSRRVERALQLLRHTTLPIKAVARQVGIGDLHLFNKIMRREMGLSPRRLRKG